MAWNPHELSSGLTSAIRDGIQSGDLPGDAEYPGGRFALASQVAHIHHLAELNDGKSSEQAEGAAKDTYRTVANWLLAASEPDAGA